MTTRLRLALTLTLGAVGLAGCSLPAPGAPAKQATSTPATGTVARVAQANASHEYTSQRPPPETARGSASAVEAIIAFAEAYTNWTADTVSAHMNALAAASLGQARSAMELAAADSGRDYELHRAGIANSGTVEAVAPMGGHGDRFVVVTLERTTASASAAYQGLRPAWHVTVATVTQLRPGVWVVSGWQPET